MMRNRWVDVNPDWVDYLEARVEAMDDEIRRLNESVMALAGENQRLRDQQPTGYGYSMPCLLV